MSNANTTEQDKQKVIDIKAGDILLASLAVAASVVAFAVLLPTTSIANILVIGIGRLKVYMVPALLICGLLAIYTSVWTVYGMSKEAHLSRRDLVKTNLGLFLIALVILGFIYVSFTSWFLFGGT